MPQETPKLESLQQFLLEVPLYTPHALSEVFSVEKLYTTKDRHSSDTIDGHCPFCHRDSTFKVTYKEINLQEKISLRSRTAIDEMYITCVRNYSHRVRYYFRIESEVVEKIGQFPSFADISNDEVSIYRKGMEAVDAREFHKAVGLAAHGVGVGSFVYLRRVFERLIYTRFEDFKAAENWHDAQFYSVRMEDKIALLKDHLPKFLVDNRKIYSILSVGIHELDDKMCLSWFEVMKQSIVIILEDDKEKRDELKRRESFSDAIKDFRIDTES